MRLVVVGGQRRGRRVRGRPVVHLRVGIGRGQVDHDRGRVRVGLVAAHRHDGRGPAGAGAAAAAAGHRGGRGRGRGRRRRRGRRLVACGRGRCVAAAAVVVERVARLAGRRGRVPLFHLHLDQFLLVDRLAYRVWRALSLVLLKHQYAIRPCLIPVVSVPIRCSRVGRWTLVLFFFF